MNVRGGSGVVVGRHSEVLQWGRGKHGVGGHIDWRLGGISAGVHAGVSGMEERGLEVAKG